MASIVRQAAYRSDVNPNIGIILELDSGTQVAVLQSQIAALSASNIQVVLRTATGIDNIFIHRNRDDTIAVAIGIEPETWPEDASWRR